MAPHSRFFKLLLSPSLLVIVFVVGLGWRASKPVSDYIFTYQTNEPPYFDETDCITVYPAFSTDKFGKGEFRCGYLITKENYDSESSKTIRLTVVIAQRENPQSLPKPSPIIYLDGGPGLHGFPWGPDDAYQYAKFFNRDVIQFGQRGTYFSQPFLDCQEYRDMVVSNWESQLDLEQWKDKRVLALQGCWKRLKDQNAFENSDSFNSRFNALDVVNLNRALEYEKAHLYGFSYGTLLAQHVLSLNPEHVASVVLDGVLPLGVEANGDSESNADRSLKKVFEDCSRDTKCNEAYLDLEPFFNEVVEKLNDQPANLTLTVEDTTYRNVKLDGYAFSETLNNLLGQSGKTGEIPRIIYAAGNGNFKEIGQAYFSFELNPFMAWGMYYAVYCTEFAGFQVERQFWNGVCNTYDPTNKSYNNVQIPANSVPILIFNGEYDPVTPPDYGARVAKALSVPADYNLTSTLTAHGSSLNAPKGEYLDCAKRIMRDFFDHPDQPPNQAPCWKKI